MQGCSSANDIREYDSEAPLSRMKPNETNGWRNAYFRAEYSRRVEKRSDRGRTGELNVCYVWQLGISRHA